MKTLNTIKDTLTSEDKKTIEETNVIFSGREQKDAVCRQFQIQDSRYYDEYELEPDDKRWVTLEDATAFVKKISASRARSARELNALMMQPGRAAAAGLPASARVLTQPQHGQLK